MVPSGNQLYQEIAAFFATFDTAMKKLKITFVALMACALAANAQNAVLLHSHNDYERVAPFWEAYSERFDSVEADVYCIDGKLFVSHDKKDVAPERTFEALYLEPVLKVFGLNGGRAWAGSEQTIQLLIDIKETTEPTLGTLVRLLEAHPDVFDPAVNPYAVRVVMTGNVPSPADFDRYPDFIFFDGNLDAEYTQGQLQRIALFSAPFYKYTLWRGRGRGSKAGWEKVMEAVERAHAQGKPIRFWGAPENETVYHVFYSLGIDYMNSDRPAECALFYKSHPELVSE
jgi:alkaline phosphatase